MSTAPKVLLYDIETAPMLGYVWGLWDQNISLNQIHSDWHVLSWAAKWLGAPASEIMYMDQRGASDIANDKRILRGIWKLLDEADIVVTQNGKSFDQRKLNARFVFHGFQPPSPVKHIDTKELAQKHFAFSSNKLEYMTDKLCVKYKKLKPSKFPGFEMWRACLAGNPEAWAEMEKYNKHDVLSLEELYEKLSPWGTSVSFEVFRDAVEAVCNCGSKSFRNKGWSYTNAGKYVRLKCNKCGHYSRGAENFFSKNKRKSLRRPA